MPHLKEKKVDEVLVLRPRGYLTGGDETEELKRRGLEAAASGTKLLVVNLQDTRQLTSPAIGALTHLYAHYKNKGGEVRVCGMPNDIRRIFEITQLTRVFYPYETEDQAVMGF